MEMRVVLDRDPAAPRRCAPATRTPSASRGATSRSRRARAPARWRRRAVEPLRRLAKSARDRQPRRGAAPARPRLAAPRPRPDRPRVRAAARRRGARPRRAHVGRAPQPPVQARLRRVAVLVPHDAPHRARDGAAAPRRPQRHRGLLRGRLLVARHVQHALHRARRRAAQRLPARGGAARPHGMRAVRRQAGDATGQESRSAGRRAAPSVTAMDITIHRACSRRTTRTPRWLLPRHARLRGPQRRRLPGHALDHRRPARPARARRSSCTRRPPTPASPTTSAARSPR